MSPIGMPMESTAERGLGPMETQYGIAAYWRAHGWRLKSVLSRA
jgi:hypothetical protein